MGVGLSLTCCVHFVGFARGCLWTWAGDFDDSGGHFLGGDYLCSGFGVGVVDVRGGLGVAVAFSDAFDSAETVVAYWVAGTQVTVGWPLFVESGLEWVIWHGSKKREQVFF